MPCRGGAASPPKLSYSLRSRRPPPLAPPPDRLVLAVLLLPPPARRSRRRLAAAAGDILEAEQDHRDVVAPAGGVGGVDQPLAERLERVGLLEHRAQLRLVDHRRQSVRAE